MIKEKKKITKYTYKKSPTQVALEYLRTFGFSILFAVMVTSVMAINTRNEMIKDISDQAISHSVIDKKLALQVIQQTDLMDNLSNKSYSMCMYIGDLYATAGDYKHAQMAYELAIIKAKPGAYKPYYKLVEVLVEQELFDKAESLIENLKDYTSKPLIKLKTRAYIIIGDKYYSTGKFLSAAKSYENANFYYQKFKKRDKVVEESIINRIVNSYIQVTDIMVKSGLNSEATRFLKKAEKYAPDNYIVRYKLAIILADSDPEKSVNYFEPLLDKIPQNIDYTVYGNALTKAANIADLDNRPTKAKYYRYRIHSIDLFVNRKVLYKNDIETYMTAFSARKILFTYHVKASYAFKNVSSMDMMNIKGDFVLCENGNPVETVTKTIANKDTPLLANGTESSSFNIKFKKNIFTKKELATYTIKIYLYKDQKYKTLVFENNMPLKSFSQKN